ncbi:hypothetical protein Tco_1230048 [Tanacetum coccineum]
MDVGDNIIDGFCYEGYKSSLGFESIWRDRLTDLTKSVIFMAIGETDPMDKTDKNYLKEDPWMQLHFVEEPIEIMDREVKQLRRSRVPIVKVRWNSSGGRVLLESLHEKGNEFDSSGMMLITILHLYIQRISLTGFPAQSVGSSNTYVLDLPCLLVLITGTSQSRQHVLFDDDTGMGFPFRHCEYKEYHSNCSGRSQGYV